MLYIDSTIPDKTFFMQSKNPIVFKKLVLPDNLIIGTTIEMNKDYDYRKISKASYLRKD